MSSSCPPWLKNAIRSQEHIQNVLEILSKREHKRQKARAASRPRFQGPIARRRSPNSALDTLNRILTHGVIPEYSVSVASSPENMDANRYTDIQPFDRTRVIVNDQSGSCNGGRYINASWIREKYGGKWWIASQAPLPTTVHTFLSILSQSDTSPPQSLCPPSNNRDTHTSNALPSLGRVRTVVQLTLSLEDGRIKAHPYFPEEIGQTEIVPPPPNEDPILPLKITLVNQDIIDSAHCVRSLLHLSYHEDPRHRSNGRTEDGVIFQHLLYTAWPDHGVPSHGDKASLLRFIRLVGHANKDMSFQPPDAHPDPPIIVGCSAGVGRTGAFITLSSLMRAYGLLTVEGVKPGEAVTRPSLAPLPLPRSPLGLLPEELEADEVAQEIDSLREQRMGMVQRSGQVLLIYELLQDAFTR